MSWAEDMGYDHYEPNDEAFAHTLKFIEVKARTDKAWLCVFKTKKGTAEKWLPKSQCDIDESVNEITVPEWLVEKNDLWEWSV